MPRELTNKSNYSYSLSGNSGKRRKDIMGFFFFIPVKQNRDGKEGEGKGKRKRGGGVSGEDCKEGRG